MRVVLYSYVWPHPRKNSKLLSNQFDIKEAPKTYSGKITKHGARRLARAIRLLVAIAEWQKVKHPTKDMFFDHKLSFVTLTLPAMQGQLTDKEIYTQALKPTLRVLREKFGVKHYVWKAERQKNNNLHYHITTDSFIHLQDLRDLWNSRMRTLGLIHLFEKKHRHDNPNSTDIHSVRDVRDLAAYMVKYMAKADKEERLVDGKVWDCSKSLKNTADPTYEYDWKSEAIWQENEFNPLVETIDFDYGKLIIWKNLEDLRGVPKPLLQEYRKFLASVKAS